MVKVTWPWSHQMCSQAFLRDCKKSCPKISHGSQAILKSLNACHKTKIVKQLKSHCDKCKFGIFFKYCVFLGREWIGFWQIVTKNIGKMKHTIKFTYLHSSPIEMQLSIFPNKSFSSIKRHAYPMGTQSLSYKINLKQPHNLWRTDHGTRGNFPIVIGPFPYT